MSKSDNRRYIKTMLLKVKNPYVKAGYGQCSKCDEILPQHAIHFHHLPNLHAKPISRLLRERAYHWDVKRDRNILKRAVARCAALCATCHALEHA